MRYLTTAVATLALATSLLAGCSPGGAGNNAAAGTGASGPGDQAFLDYAHCMRDNGVSDFPDPIQRPGHSGLTLDNGNTAGEPGYPAADAACKHFIQSIVDLKSAAAHSAVTPAVLDGLIAYARCMREHQISMLDPDPSDGHIALGPVAGLPNDVGRGDPQFHTADAACRSKLPAGVSDDGTGPA